MKRCDTCCYGKRVDEQSGLLSWFLHAESFDGRRVLMEESSVMRVRR